MEGGTPPPGTPACALAARGALWVALRMTEPATAPVPKPRRRGLALALVLVASVLAFAAILAVWANRQVLNTDNWTTASSRMLESPAVRDQLSAYLVDQLYANVDVEAQIREALPPRAQPLAGPAAGLLRDRIELRARQRLSRPETQERWEDANRAAHQALMRVIDGDVESVELDLKALLEQTEQQAGVGGRVAGALPAGAARITILRSDQLDGVQAVGKLLKSLPVVLVVLSLGLFGAALAVAPGWRRQAVRAYGAGLVVAGAGALVASSLTGDAVVGALAQTAATEPAVRNVWDISTTLLEEAAVATIGYGLVMIGAAWLAGPSAWATALRRNLAPYLREPALAYGALAVLAAIVVLWWSPTPATRNPVTAIVLLALLALGFEGLRRRTAAEFPNADRTEAHQRMRQGLARLGASTRARAGAAAGRASELASTASAQARARSARAERDPSPEDLRLERLERLEHLRADGILDDAEFRAEKARILSGEERPQPPAPLAQ
jgi:hypothetical protein